MTPKINILICDDHAILLEGLKVCLLHMPEVDKEAFNKYRLKSLFIMICKQTETDIFATYF